jgi:hypothetical protein
MVAIGLYGVARRYECFHSLIVLCMDLHSAVIRKKTVCITIKTDRFVKTNKKLLAPEQTSMEARSMHETPSMPVPDALLSADVAHWIQAYWKQKVAPTR